MIKNYSELVYKFVSSIPKGKVTTYGYISKKLKINSARLVGQILHKNIDPKNKHRLIRAIEIAKTLGKVPKIKVKTLPYKFMKIGLYLPPEKLKKKVGQRVKKMFKNGLLKEIKKLKKSGVSDQRLKELGFEYDYPTPEKVIKETLQYAKRQTAWFKRDKEIKWFELYI